MELCNFYYKALLFLKVGEMMQRSRGILLTLIGGICWGFSGACGQYLFQHKAFTPMWLASFRLPIAGILMLIYYLVKEQSLKKLFSIWKEPKMYMLLIAFAIFGMAANQSFYYLTINSSNAGTATVLEYLSPLILIVYIACSKKQLPSMPKIVALTLALGGIFVLVTHGDIKTVAISRETMIYGLLAAITYALISVLPEKLMDRYGTIYVVGWGMFIGGLSSWIIQVPWRDCGIIDKTSIILLMVAVFIGSMLAYLWYMQGVHLIGAQLANLLACIEPISATIFAVIWLRSSMSIYDYFGFALIISAIIIASAEDKMKVTRDSV